MKIRSITGFAPSIGDIEAAASFLAGARSAYESAGITVQTVRLALAPLGGLFPPETPPAAVVALGRELEERGHDLGIDYLALGPHRPGDPGSWAIAIVQLLAETQRVFATLALDDGKGTIYPEQADRAAKIVVEAAPLEPNGFANLRFATLANVKAGVPFLPAAFAAVGARPRFAIATESADLARNAFAGAESLEGGADALVTAIEENARAIESVARELESPDGFGFDGIDFSLAPFPGDKDSVGATLESMGLASVGGPGTALAAAVLTTALDRARFTRTGFSGLFLPVLEDDRLARRAAEGSLGLCDLMLASAVCGTGLDTIPLPGDTQAGAIVGWLLDLAALSIRLDKPLTARLMPMPRRAAGDSLDFDFPFFASGRVMAIRPAELTGLLRRGPIRLRPRHQRGS